jgi:hypothetical protein
LIGLLVLAFTGMVFCAGYSAAVTFTQAQVDALKTDDVITSLDINPEAAWIYDDIVYLTISYNKITKDEVAKNFIILRASAVVPISKDWLNKCIAQKGLAICKADYIKPELLEGAKLAAAREIANVESMKTKTDLFTLGDLIDIVSKKELNDKNLLTATVGAG